MRCGKMPDLELWMKLTKPRAMREIAEIETENIKLTQSIKEKDSEIAKLQSDLKTVIDQCYGFHQYRNSQGIEWQGGFNRQPDKEV